MICTRRRSTSLTRSRRNVRHANGRPFSTITRVKDVARWTNKLSSCIIKSMKKNGKMISCRFCGKDAYFSASRIGVRVYCNSECARNDNFGFKTRMKECVICGKQFEIKNGIQVQKKTCSYECWKKNNRAISSKRSSQKTNIKCTRCGILFKGLLHYSERTGKCYDCRMDDLKMLRKGKNNPNYSAGLYIKTIRNSRQQSKHLSACQKYKKNFIEMNGYKFCELCKVNQNGTPQFQVHHIYFASRFPKNKELHNFKNLILLCLRCHQQFHNGRNYDEYFVRLEKERGLKKLFNSKYESKN